MGQYTQVDPIGLAGGNPTLYGYVFNSLGDIDPFGLNRLPSLPPPTVLQSGNTTIKHLYHAIGEHANPIHFHVFENNRNIAKIRADGSVID